MIRHPMKPFTLLFMMHLRFEFTLVMICIFNKGKSNPFGGSKSRIGY